MGNNSSNSSASGITAPPNSTTNPHRNTFLGAFTTSTRRLEFTLTNMRTLHTQLTQFSSLPDAEIVELLRVLAEFLIYSDQHRVSVESEAVMAMNSEKSVENPGSFFDYFGETNMLALFVSLGMSEPSFHVQVQLLQTMSILIQNIATRTSLYYLLSNNYINRLLECPFAVESDDDVRDWYVTLLKALSIRLNEETVQFFLDTQHGQEDVSFPLYTRALKFGRFDEPMVKVAVKTLTLNVLKVPDVRVRQFILQYDDLNYFRDIVEIANDLTLTVQGLLNKWPASDEHTQKTAYVEKLEEAVDAYIDHCFYLQDLLDVNVPELCYKIGDLFFSRHVKYLLATSILPDCGPPPQRVSTQLALYLLTRLLGTLEHKPLVNAITFVLMSPDATEDCEYSAVDRGCGLRRQHSSSHGLESVDSNDDNEDTMTIEKLLQPVCPHTSLRWDKETPPMYAFCPHSTATCDSSLCYVQTRFSMGEWPVDEVKSFVLQSTNCYRQSLLSLLCSSDERLSSTAVMLLLSIVNNKAVDDSLLRELDLLPFRRRHEKCMFDCGDKWISADVHDKTAQTNATDDDCMTGGTVLPVAAALSSSYESSGSQEMYEDAKKAISINKIDTKGFAPIGDDDEVSGATEVDNDLSCRTDAYSFWLVELILEVLARNQRSRLFSTQLCARLLMDLMMDTHVTPSRCLTRHHAATLKHIHSSSAHAVMDSMCGAMAEVDLFIYVFENEVARFQRKCFPMELQLDSSSPFECLVPLEKEETFISPAWAGSQDTLALRCPANDMEECRKSMRVFLLLRKLRKLLDPSYVNEGLDRIVAFRHPRTNVLASAAGRSGSSAPLDGMVSLKCMYREQRFLLMSTRLLMVMNPEAFVLVEKVPDQTDDTNLHDGEGEGIVKVFAPIHRTYCTMDPRDDRVLQVSVRSALPVPGCRSARKDYQDVWRLGKLMDWNVMLMFPTPEDCAQAQAHINISGTEVRAFKLRHIKESLTTHLHVPQSRSYKWRRLFHTNTVSHTTDDDNEGECKYESSNADTNGDIGESEDDGEEEIEEDDG